MSAKQSTECTSNHPAFDASLWTAFITPSNGITDISTFICTNGTTNIQTKSYQYTNTYTFPFAITHICSRVHSCQSDHQWCQNCQYRIVWSNLCGSGAKCHASLGYRDIVLLYGHCTTTTKFVSRRKGNCANGKCDYYLQWSCGCLFCQ